MLPKKYVVFSCLFCVLMLPVPGLGLEVHHHPVPGGVAVVEFSSDAPRPKARYRGVDVFVQPLGEGVWQALVGLALQNQLGRQELLITGAQTPDKTVAFEVIAYEYPAQHINFKKGDGNQKYMTPSAEQVERFEREREVLTKARKSNSAPVALEEIFVRPLKGVITGEFGVRRFFNGEPRRPHTGVDFAADRGTQIRSPARGQVILVGDFFFNGKSVFIDHGQGLVSAYLHLQEAQVQQGQSVIQGSVIGTVGSTGRSTGPHLHWGVYLNGSAVNPLLFIDGS